MKVKVSFKLDLSECPTLNMDTVESINGGLQGLASFFHDLILFNSQAVMRFQANQVLSELDKQAMIEYHESKLAVAKTLFDNYTVSGETEDGHDFVFAHKESGYTLTIDGITKDFTGQ